MTEDRLSQFSNAKYLSIETYKKTGSPVRTPVWFAESDGVFYVYTEANAGKVKRIRNNSRVKIAPCDMRGGVKGDWIDATARIEDEDGALLGQSLLNQKYWTKRIGDFFSRLARHKQAIISIKPL
jgi:uncharacterized protein